LTSAAALAAAVSPARAAIFVRSRSGRARGLQITAARFVVDLAAFTFVFSCSVMLRILSSSRWRKTSCDLRTRWFAADGNVGFRRSKITFRPFAFDNPRTQGTRARIAFLRRQLADNGAGRAAAAADADRRSRFRPTIHLLARIAGGYFTRALAGASA